MAESNNSESPAVNQEEQDEAMRLWRERYGNMVPERIVDTKIGEDGQRYYKIQWAASTMEPSKNFLEAELLVKKYWDPVEKKLKLPSHRADRRQFNEASASTSTSRSSRVSDIQDVRDETEATSLNAITNLNPPNSRDDDRVKEEGDPKIDNSSDDKTTDAAKCKDLKVSLVSDSTSETYSSSEITAGQSMSANSLACLASVNEQNDNFEEPLSLPSLKQSETIERSEEQCESSKESVEFHEGVKRKKDNDIESEQHNATTCKEQSLTKKIRKTDP